MSKIEDVRKLVEDQNKKLDRICKPTSDDKIQELKTWLAEREREEAGSHLLKIMRWYRSPRREEDFPAFLDSLLPEDMRRFRKRVRST